MFLEMNSFHKVVAKAIEASKSPDDVSLQETEEKFSSLALAFQTDKLTLDRRKELHLRARDVAEENIHRELEGLKDGMKALNQICNNPSSQQIFSKVQRHIEVLENAIARMSSRAEVHGAVQQELRVNQAIDVMVKHVENLKKVYEKEHAELLEARKTLRATRQDSRESGGNDNGISRTNNQPGLPQFRANRRRASIAVISKNPLQLRNSLSSSFKPPDNPSRLVHRNSSFIIPPLCFEEENEESESTDIPCRLARRKSSSIIEDLPSDFLSRLQASSSQSRQEGSKDLEEEKEEQEEPDESTSKDPVMRDYDNRVLETELSSDVFDCSSCSPISVPLKQLLSRKQSLKLMTIPSKLQKLREKIHPVLKYFPRVRFQDKTHQFVVISVITISACVILALWLGWFHLLFGRLFATGK